MLYAVEIPCMGFYNMPVPFFNYHTARHIEKTASHDLLKKCLIMNPQHYLQFLRAVFWLVHSVAVLKEVDHLLRVHAGVWRRTY